MTARSAKERENRNQLVNCLKRRLLKTKRRMTKQLPTSPIMVRPQLSTVSHRGEAMEKMEWTVEIEQISYVSDLFVRRYDIFLADHFIHLFCFLVLF